MPVYKDTKNKRWFFLVTKNYKQYKRILWHGKYMLTKTEAINAEREFLSELGGISEDNLTMLDLFNEYVKASKTSLKASTQATYDNFRNRYLASLKDKKIYELTPKDVLLWRNDLDSFDLSTTYKNRVQNIMKNLLSFGTIMYNLNGKLQYSLLQPFKDNEVKVIDIKTKYLEIDNFKLMLKDLDKDDYYYIVLWTLYFTGLRIGELAALTKSDIKKEYILVNKDYSRVKGKDIIQAPKNKNSIRKVPLDPVTSEMLQKFIQDKTDDEIVFRNKSKFLNQQKLRRKIKTLQAYAGLEDYEITPHTLRHSYSSNLKKLGYDEYTISKLMGNTPQVASSTYIHTNLNFEEISKNMNNLQ